MTPTRLRVERLVLVESRSPTLKVIREVRFRPGLNIVWAIEHEPVADGQTERRAGHGVGKTTLTLMLRAILGDDGAAVKTMRSHLAEHFASGGLGAEVTVDGDRYAVFRAFGPGSFARRGGSLESLFENEPHTPSEFSDYVTALGESACLRHLPLRELVTGQPVAWGQVLCWIARDQGLGLRHFYRWRAEDGTGLRRPVKDPPVLVRTVLGLVSRAEANAETEMIAADDALATARDALRAEEQRASGIRGVVESQFRQWVRVSQVLPIDSDDLFAPSVTSEVARKRSGLEKRIRDDQAVIERLDGEIAALDVEIHAMQPAVEIAELRWRESAALAKGDQQELDDLRARRDRLNALAGTCTHGNIAFADCSHVVEQRETISLRANRDVGALTRSVAELDAAAKRALSEFEAQRKRRDDLVVARDAKAADRSDRRKAIESNTRDLGRGDAIRQSLDEWQERRSTAETESLRRARSAVTESETRLESAERKLVIARQQAAAREERLGARMNELATAFGLTGRFAPTDAERPFQLVGANGEGYAVLEVLLGDLACALDGARGENAHPGFLMFDSPREADLSLQLYARFLTLLDEISQAVPTLQVIVTTTTPPPEALREPPACVAKLSHAQHELLLKRRLENLLARAARSPSEGG